MTLDWSFLIHCASGPLGRGYELLVGEKTDKIKLLKQNIPWITINGNFTGDIQTKAQSQLLKLVCDNYTVSIRILERSSVIFIFYIVFYRGPNLKIALNKYFPNYLKNSWLYSLEYDIHLLDIQFYKWLAINSVDCVEIKFLISFYSKQSTSKYLLWWITFEFKFCYLMSKIKQECNKVSLNSLSWERFTNTLLVRHSFKAKPITALQWVVQ